MSTCLKMTRELAKRLLMLKPLIKLLDIQFFPVVLPVVLQCIALPYESHVTRNLARMRRAEEGAVERTFTFLFSCD